MPPENESLRDTLESAFDEHSAPDTADTTQPVSTPTETTAPVTTTEAVDRGDGRTPRGKFARRVEKADDGVVVAPAAAPADSTVVAGKTDGGEAAAKVVDQFAKAPQSWKPGAREAWSSLPPDVRAEVHRREHEAATVMQETAQARQVQNYLGQLQQRFAPALQAEGVDVLTAASNLMNLSSKLRFGTPSEKASLAAQIIKSYGVDVNALADALDGQQMQQQQQPIMQDPRVDQLLAQLNEAKQTNIQRTLQNATTEVEHFGSDKEFFGDVRGDMADILELAARKKVDITLEQAYDRACKMHPDIGPVLIAREAAERARNQNGSTLKARHAASSVRGTPTGMSTSTPGDLRSTIEAAFEQVDGR